MKKTWDRAAMRIASAQYNAPEAMLEVVFENGDRFLVAVETVLPRLLSILDTARFDPPVMAYANSVDNRRSPAKPVLATQPDWSNLRIGETRDVIEAAMGDDLIEIPWDRIRAVADPEFRAHLADRAAERARKIGARLRAMRLAAGVTPAALAKKVNLPLQVLTDMESGRIDPQTDVIEYIALALGHSPRDFADE